MATPQMIYWCRAKTAYQKTAPALSPRWGRFFSKTKARRFGRAIRKHSERDEANTLGQNRHKSLFALSPRKLILSDSQISADVLPRLLISSKLTLAPSLRLLSPAFSTAEMCTKTSLPPLSG